MTGMDSGPDPRFHDLLLRMNLEPGCNGFGSVVLRLVPAGPLDLILITDL